MLNSYFAVNKRRVIRKDLMIELMMMKTDKII